MLRKKLLLVIPFITLVILIMIIVMNGLIPKTIVTEKSRTNIVRVLYQGKEISFDETEVLEVLSDYYSKKTIHKMGGYPTDQVEIEIDLEEDHKPKHILLGEFYLWYESTGKSIFEIINGQELLKELKTLFE